MSVDSFFLVCCYVLYLSDIEDSPLHLRQEEREIIFQVDLSETTGGNY